MKRNEPVTHVMTASPLNVHTGQKLSDVRKLLSEKDIHHVPVTNGNKLVGLISSSDMLRLSFSEFGATDERSLDALLDSQFSIEEVMAKDLKTLNETDTVRTAAIALHAGHFHSLPVVDKDNALKGIVTSTDIINYLIDQY